MELLLWLGRVLVTVHARDEFGAVPLLGRYLVTADLERFGRRDQLTVTWQLDQVDEAG